MRITIALVAFVAFGLWIVQTDCFPISQNIRPSWYLYGWPICFATSARDRFGFMTFKLAPLTIDAIIALLMLGCTYVATRHFAKRNRTFTLTDALAATAGFAMALIVITGAYSTLLEMVSFPPPVTGYSEMDGNSRPLNRISIAAIPSICIGFFSIGFATSLGILRCLNYTRTTPSADSSAG